MNLIAVFLDADETIYWKLIYKTGSDFEKFIQCLSNINNEFAFDYNISEADYEDYLEHFGLTEAEDIQIFDMTK